MKRRFAFKSNINGNELIDVVEVDLPPGELSAEAREDLEDSAHHSAIERLDVWFIEVDEHGEEK